MNEPTAGYFVTEANARFYLQSVELRCSLDASESVWVARIYRMPAHCIGHPTKCGTYIASSTQRPSAALALAAGEVVLRAMPEREAAHVS